MLFQMQFVTKLYRKLQIFKIFKLIFKLDLKKEKSTLVVCRSIMKEFALKLV